VAGTTEFPWKSWAAADLVGVVLWSAYNTGLGAIGGRTFENQTWKGLLLAFGLAAATAGILEGVRWLIHRRGSGRGSRPTEAAAPRSGR
jgi:membrane protein DedA with SNARE-associated domain